VQTLPGIGPILAAVFVTEIGDITRFPAPAKLASWAGLTPKRYESDTTVHRGRISKQGSRLVRWAAVEAVQRVGKHTRLGAYRDRVAQRPGRNIRNVAAARELVEYVYYTLRDGTCRRALTPAAALATRTAARARVDLLSDPQHGMVGPNSGRAPVAFVSDPQPHRRGRPLE
jgi:hypothetical protein